MEALHITEEMMNEFEKYLVNEEKSKNTVEKYLRDLRSFKEFTGNNEVNKETVIRYKENLISKGYAVKSVNSMIISINVFLAFKGLEHMKARTIKEQRQIYCPEEKELTREEYIDLVNAAEKNGKIRLKNIIQTICGTGIRISELKFITVEAVKSGKAYVYCKGKRRTVFIIKSLQKKLLKYIKDEKIKSGCIFVTRTGKPVSRTNIWRDMKKLCEKAKVNPEKVFPHNLRHLFARVFYGIEKDIVKLADVLGHNSINTTRIYIISTGEEHRRYMERMRLII